MNNKRKEKQLRFNGLGKVKEDYRRLVKVYALIIAYVNF